MGGNARDARRMRNQLPGRSATQRSGRNGAIAGGQHSNDAGIKLQSQWRQDERAGIARSQRAHSHWVLRWSSLGSRAILRAFDEHRLDRNAHRQPDEARKETSESCHRASRHDTAQQSGKQSHAGGKRFAMTREAGAYRCRLDIPDVTRALQPPFGKRRFASSDQQLHVRAWPMRLSMRRVRGMPRSRQQPRIA